MKSLRTCIAVLAFLSVVAVTANAAPIGVLNFAGSVQVGEAGMVRFIDWFAYQSPPVGGITTGTFIITPGSNTGVFEPLEGTQGTIRDLTDPPFSPGPVFLPNFLTFAANPGIWFNLTGIALGTGTVADCLATAAPGQICTPPGSPFTLVNVQRVDGGFDTSIGLSVLADGVDAAGSLPYFGSFSTQIAGQSLQQVLARINSGERVTASYSANFVPIPEPASFLLIGGGLLAAGWLRRRRK